MANPHPLIQNILEAHGAPKGRVLPEAPYWNGVDKYGPALCMDHFILHIMSRGFGAKDGDGELVVMEDQLDWDRDEDGKDYVVVPVTNSDLLFLRDQLNKLFPPALEASGHVELLDAIRQIDALSHMETRQKILAITQPILSRFTPAAQSSVTQDKSVDPQTLSQKCIQNSDSPCASSDKSDICADPDVRNTQQISDKTPAKDRISDGGINFHELSAAGTEFSQDSVIRAWLHDAIGMEDDPDQRAGLKRCLAKLKSLRFAVGQEEIRSRFLTSALTSIANGTSRNPRETACDVLSKYASADTHPKGGDAKQAPSKMSGAASDSGDAQQGSGE